MSNRDMRLVLAFWKSPQKSIVTKLTFSTAYHPQSNRQTEWTTQIIEDMLRACYLDHKVNWVDIVPLIKFVYDNSYQSTIKMASYETLYRCERWSPLY